MKQLTESLEMHGHLSGVISKAAGWLQLTGSCARQAEGRPEAAVGLVRCG